MGALGIGTRKTLIILVIGVFVWSTLLPIILVRNLYPSEPAISTQFRPGQTTHITPKHTDGFWSLSKANPADIQSLDWYEKSRLVVDNNRNYLDQVKDRATKSSSTITLVSGLFDLGRGDLDSGFNRKFTEYVKRFSSFMKYDFPKIIYIQAEHYHLYEDMIKSSPGPVHVINMTLDDIRAQPYYQLVQDIRLQPEWYNRGGWLKDSPQATLDLYNPMVMSKIFWTRDAARINPFNTDSFLWIDGGHLCNNPDKVTQNNADVFKRHFDKFLMTLFEYVPHAGEIHGFEEEPYREYTDSVEDSYLYVGRGGVFGGTKEFLEVTAEVYKIALMDTLEHGYMGTEENIFAILWYRFPELVHGYQNEHGGNCAIWYESIHRQSPTPIEHPVVEYAEGGWDLRGLRCEGRNDDIVCYSGGSKCPAHVTPAWLEKGENQYSCTNVEEKFCTVECKNGQVYWYAHSCYSRGKCPPHGTVPWSKFYDVNPLPNHKPIVRMHPRIKEKLLKEAKEAQLANRNVTKYEKEFMAKLKSKYRPEVREMLQQHGYNLRGLHCGILDGKPTCYRKFISGIEICPSWITPELLSEAKGQWACRPEAVDTYCIAHCQEGTDKIQWVAHQVAYCTSNPNNCEPQPEKIPYDDFYLQEWPFPPKVPPKCDSRSVSEFKGLKPFTVGVLARGTEIDTLQITMRTWEERGFLQYAPEVLFMINQATPEMLSFLSDYQKPPYNVRVITSESNQGILTGLNWLMGNSTYDYFLFLEKDFRLVESLPCTLEQLHAGLDLLESGKSEVIKYRSRYNPGRPNWAESLYRDKEETVFQRQPNLLCNFYHWIDQPEQRWPDHFKICYEDPVMYCSDAEFCNWTNNPFLIDRKWWFREYLEKFPQFQNPPKELDLETFMNWEPDAWNHRGWTIAQGDGMFKHSDTNKFGF